MDGFTIRGCRGSMAEIYAGENGFRFVPEDGGVQDRGFGALDATGADEGDFVVKRGVLEVWMGSGDHVAIPRGVRFIAQNAFAYEQIASLSLPEGLLYVGEGAFQVTGIRSIVLPDSLLFIDRYAFADCAELERVTLSNRLISIREGAFSGCPRLSRITIPTCVREIEREAFHACHPDLTICGPKGGEAERYAKDNGLCFETIE